MKKEKFRRDLLNPFRLNLFFWGRLPLAAICGLKLLKFESNNSEVGIRLKYLTKNPFGSVYFAAQAMAAELSTGVLVYYHSQFEDYKVSMLVTGMQATYLKKAKGKLRFIAQIEDKHPLLQEDKDSTLQEGMLIRIESIGFDENDEQVAVFQFDWSLKRK